MITITADLAICGRDVPPTTANIETENNGGALYGLNLSFIISFNAKSISKTANKRGRLSHKSANTEFWCILIDRK